MKRFTISSKLGGGPKSPEPFSTGAYARKLISQHKLSKLAGERPGLGAQKIPIAEVKVGIVGAGIAGLYAAFILKKLNIPFEIIEAGERIGGRIWTHYFKNWSDEPNTASYYDYFDVGAMRFPLIPTMNRLLGTKCDEKYAFGLIDQLNEQKLPNIHPITFEKYILSHENDTALVQYNGITFRKEQLTNLEDQFGFGKENGGDVPKDEIKKGPDFLLNAVYQPFIEELAGDFNSGFQALAKVDKHSVRSYMRDSKGYSEEAISWLETINSATGLFEESFTESVMDSFDFSSNDWVCIAGGASRLIELMLASLLSGESEERKKEILQVQSKVTKVSPNKNNTEIEVVVQKYPPSKENNHSVTKSYSHVILTPTLAALRSMDLKECNLSYRKRKALRTLHYDLSVKVAIRFKSRWWEDPKVMGEGKVILGGTSVTDSPVRVVVYPSYGLEAQLDNLPGVLIVSYTWAQDAGRIGSLDEKEAVDLCLRCLRELHGPVVDDQQVEEYFVHSWQDDPLMCGAFALYGPTQFQRLYPSLVEPELGGRLHIAGEAASVHHAWIIGSLNSAYRSVWEILKSIENSDAKCIEMIENFGKIDEVEYGRLDQLDGSEFIINIPKDTQPNKPRPLHLFNKFA